MYTFVRIHKKNSNEYGVWYLKPTSTTDIDDHFKTICRREIAEGIRDFIKSPQGHRTNSFALATTLKMDTCGGSFLGNALELENLTYKNRIDFFKTTQIYLPEGMQIYSMPSNFEIVETIEKSELVYPVKTAPTIADVRYMQWNMEEFDIKGKHWYAKIGNWDIVDEQGRMKWNTKAEAEEAAKWFIDNIANS